MLEHAIARTYPDTEFAVANVSSSDNGHISAGLGVLLTSKDVKAERLAAALRENLKRRKAQARGRKADDKAGAADETPGPRQAASATKTTEQ
jgi:hypothetical protein